MTAIHKTVEMAEIHETINIHVIRNTFAILRPCIKALLIFVSCAPCEM